MAEAPAALYYLQGCPPGFAAQADVLFIVEGTELPVHSQCLSRYSGFFASMFSDLDEQPATPTKGGGPAAFSRRAPLRLEEPFAGVRLQHARLFLASLYSREKAATIAKALTDPQDFAGVYDLANRFDCSVLQGALQARLADLAAGSAMEEMLKSDPLGWIEFADRFSLPDLRGRCVALLLRLLVEPTTGEHLLIRLDWSRADQSLSQLLFGGLPNAVRQLQSPKWACRSCGHSLPGGPATCERCAMNQRSAFMANKLSTHDITTALPSAAKLAAWANMSDVLRL